MANLLSSENVAAFTGVLGDHFDTFSRSITIHKEPKKILSSINSNNSYAGYGETSNQAVFTYVPQSQSFQAIISYKNEQASEVTQIGSFPLGMIKIKVQEAAADYIKNGKTEKIEVDGKSFNAVTEDKVQHYLGLQYYMFFLQQTS